MKADGKVTLGWLQDRRNSPRYSRGRNAGHHRSGPDMVAERKVHAPSGKRNAVIQPVLSNFLLELTGIIIIISKNKASAVSIHHATNACKEKWK
jgi:hypothetical protein